jgi:hypothetical protein
LREHDADELAAALVRGRASEPVLADWYDTARHAAEIARVSVNRVHRAEIRRLASQAVLVDRAMRSVRVLARRAPTAARSGAQELEELAALVERYASAVRSLAAALTAGAGTDKARDELAAVAADADPRVVGEGQWQVQSLVLLLRSPIVDTLEAAGLSPGEARDALPEI